MLRFISSTLSYSNSRKSGEKACCWRGDVTAVTPLSQCGSCDLETAQDRLMRACSGYASNHGRQREGQETLPFTNTDQTLGNRRDSSSLSFFFF